MTRGTQFLNNSKFASCKKMNKVAKVYGYMGQNRNLALKGYCPSCNKNKIKSLPYTKQQLEMEGKGIKKFFRIVWNKAIKPARKHVGSNILKNPERAFQIASQIGAASALKSSSAIMNASVQAGKIGITGRGIRGGKISALTDAYSGNGLYLGVPK